MLAGRIAQARLVICHGGIGLLGEAMRAGKPLIVMPRRGRPTRASPAGDQTALVRRLAERHPLAICDEPSQLKQLIRTKLEAGRELATLRPRQRRATRAGTLPGFRESARDQLEPALGDTATEPLRAFLMPDDFGTDAHGHGRVVARPAT